MTRRRVHLSIPPSLWSAVQAAAEAEDLSVSEWIRDTAQLYLESDWEAPPQTADSQRVQLRLPPELAESLEGSAGDQGLTVPLLIRAMLAAELE